MKTTLILLLTIISTNIFSQGTFELTISQVNYLCCTHEITLIQENLIVKKDHKTIFRKRIRDRKKLEHLTDFISSKAFQDLDNNYSKPALDGFYWKYEINHDDYKRTIVNENEMVPILLELNRLVNELGAKKKAHVLVETY